MLKALKRGSAAILASIALILGTMLAANALTYSPDPIQDGDSVTVVSTRTDLPKGDYKVSICTTKKYGIFGLELIPACAEGATIKNFGGGRLTTKLAPIYRDHNVNVHAFLTPSQRFFSCQNYGDCEILIVKHEKLFKKEIMERKLIEIKQ